MRVWEECHGTPDSIVVPLTTISDCHQLAFRRQVKQFLAVGTPPGMNAARCRDRHLSTRAGEWPHVQSRTVPDSSTGTQSMPIGRELSPQFPGVGAQEQAGVSCLRPREAPRNRDRSSVDREQQTGRPSTSRTESASPHEQLGLRGAVRGPYCETRRALLARRIRDLRVCPATREETAAGRSRVKGVVPRESMIRCRSCSRACRSTAALCPSRESSTFHGPAGPARQASHAPCRDRSNHVNCDSVGFGRSVGNRSRRPKRTRRHAGRRRYGDGFATVTGSR